jgi:hypothetical protein
MLQVHLLIFNYALDICQRRCLTARPYPSILAHSVVYERLNLAIELAWSMAPEGCQRWALRLLADRLAALGLAAAYA